MKRLVSMFTALTLAVAALVAGPAHADGGNGGSGTVSVMKHVCPANIKSEADFDALGGFLQKVLTCPVITREGDQGTGAANAGQTNFDFSVAGGGMSHGISSAKFMPAKLCESDLNTDVDGDGQKSSSTCVDISHYVYSGVSTGHTTIKETMAPQGHMFGSIEFTPSALDGNNDADTLERFGNSVIELNTSRDKDGTTMVHVYNFKMAGMPETGGGGMAAGGSVPMGGIFAGGSLLVTLLAGGLAVVRRRLF